jgi:hypothetical protein
MVAPKEVQAVSQNVDGWSYIERDAGQMSDGKFDFREEDVVCVVGRRRRMSSFYLTLTHLSSDGTRYLQDAYTQFCLLLQLE